MGGGGGFAETWRGDRGFRRLGLGGREGGEERVGTGTRGREGVRQAMASQSNH